MIKFWLMSLGFHLVVAYSVYAQGSDPTVVFGEAANPDGGKNVFVVEQPNNEVNPLGDPLPNIANDKNINTVDKVENTYPENIKPQSTEGEHISDSDLPKEDAELGRQFRNTLLEANGMVYDVQSYPEKDFELMNNSADPQTIYSPNVND